MTIARKIGVLLLLPTLGAQVSLAVLLAFFSATESDVRVTNVAGRQRMLAWKIGDYVRMAALGHAEDRVELLALVREYDASLLALVHGGRVLDEEIPPASPRVRAELAELERLWAEGRPRILFVAGSPLGDPAGRKAAEELRPRLASLADAAQGLVLAHGAAVRATAARILRLSIATVALDVALLVLGVWFVVARVARPARRLVEAAGRVGAGDFSCEVPVASRDEIGTLAHAFNEMSGRVAASLEASRASERRLKELLDGVDGVVWEADPETLAVRRVGGRALEILGHPIERWLSEPGFLGAHVHEEDRAEVLRALRAAAVAETPARLVYRAVRPDGRVVWLRCDVRAVRDAARAVRCLHGLAVDVTREKEAEAALRRACDDVLARDRALGQSEDRQRQLLDAITDLVCVKGPRSELVWANKAFRDHFGVSLEQLQGRATESFESAEAGARRVKTDAAVFASGRPVAIPDEPSTRHDGKVLTLDVVKSPIFDADGKVALLVAVARDVTERKALEESHARLAMAVEQAAEAIIVVTATDGTITYVNPAFERSTGYSREEAVGRNTRFLKSGEHGAEFYRQMWATLLRGETWHGRLTNKKKDGALFEEEATISPLRDPSGTIVSYVAVKRDVTREARLEEQLRQAQKMEAVGRLAGGVAHDFNNVLTAINGYSDLVLDRLDAGAPLRREISEIRKAGGRAASLTRQLLAFGRRQVLQPKVLDLNAIVEGLGNMLRRLIGEDIDLAVIAAPSLGRVKADPGQLEQVLVNLVVNARDAMPRGGKLTIETKNADLDEAYASRCPDVAAGPYVLLSVTDTGTGMDGETLSHLFEPFFTTKARGKGTGLGLSTVYGIVKQSGGHVTATSEPARGTTFRVYLPRVDEQPDATRPSGATALSPRGTETVLVAEDEDIVRALVTTVLEMNGYTVLAAPDGEEALSLCRGHDGEIHLLLTDMVLPEMSGREIAERLAPLRPAMRVLYMSGYTEDAIAHHGVLAPGVAFLQKPFTPGALAREVRAVLDAKA